MLRRSIWILAAALIGLSTAGANAQKTLAGPTGGSSLSRGPDYDLIDKSERVEDGAKAELRALRQAGVEAMSAKNYQAAEKAFSDLLLRNPDALDANFLLGLARLGLEKWAEARGPLEIAVRQDPKRPEPRTRLGLTYVKLGEIEAAKQQRAELASLDSACMRACEDARWIADGLVLLDTALKPSATGAAPAPTAMPKIEVAATAAATPDNFDPKKYNLVPFKDLPDLYGLLTKEGRCPPGKLAEPKQPCALILYKRVNGTDAGLAANFKPVFSVISRRVVWAIHDKKLQKVNIEDLYFDEEEIIGKGKTGYQSVALIGNAENKANCEQGRSCLSDLVVQDMFAMYSSMPDSVVAVIWGERMKDHTTYRVR